jgi:hypothetical protein
MIEETIPSYLMGTFGIITNLAITFGEMIAILMGAGLSDIEYTTPVTSINYYWRLLLVFPIIFSVV